MAVVESSPRESARSEDAIPTGFGVVWDADVTHLDDGRVVVGGTPTRLVRLGAGARQRIDGLTGSEPVPVPARTWRDVVRPLLDAGLLHPRPPVAATGLEHVTVVIPVRDRWEALYRLLPTVTGAARVIVVDDGSTDGTAEVAEAFGVDVIRLPQRRGPAAARNAGLAQAQTPIVTFLDSDIRLEAGWYRPLLAHFADPTVAVVAPRVVGDVAERSDALARYEVARSPLDIGRQGGYVRPRNRASFLPSAMLVARTEALAQAGGFDAALQVGEDVDLVWRLGDAGWRVRYEPAAVVYHDARPTLLGLLRRRVDYGTSAAALHRRHPGKVAPVGISPWSAAVWGPVAAGMPGVGALVAAGTTARLARSLRGLVRDRWQAAWRVTVPGHIGVARMLAAAVSRAWLPLAVLALWRWPATRPALGAALVVPPLADWARQRPPMSVAAYSALHLADDAAYCAGVWIGCARERTLGPLIPQLYRGTPVLPGPDHVPTTARTIDPSEETERTAHAA